MRSEMQKVVALSSTEAELMSDVRHRMRARHAVFNEDCRISWAEG
jgi:hypothetical protein